MCDLIAQSDLTADSQIKETMKETSQSIKNLNKNEKIKAILINGIKTGIIVSLIMNSTIVWAILNGDTSDLKSLILQTLLLITGGVLGEYLFGRKLEELFQKHK